MTETVAATEFCRNFAAYQRQVQRGPIEVQSHGRPTGYFISPEDFEHYQRVIAASRKAYHPSELPAHIQEAIRTARMSSEHDHLNALIDGD